MKSLLCSRTLPRRLPAHQRRSDLRTRACFALMISAALACCARVPAQEVTQTLTLQKGWNAVYVEVAPANGDPARVFAGLPVAGVWTRADRLSAVDFIQDPAEPVFNEAAWLKWYPPPQPGFLSDLREIQGRRAYLVKMLDGPATLQVQGQPALRAIPWVTDAWNLRGFPVVPVNPPTFRQYFSNSTNHFDVARNALRGVYRLASSGAWILAGPDEPMRPGEACWVFCQGASSFTGPLEVSVSRGDGLEFGQTLQSLRVSFVNRTKTPRAVSVSQVTPVIPGLLAFQQFRENSGPGWSDLPNPLTFNLAPEAQATFSVAIRRSRISGAHHASTLQVTDDRGLRYIVPVTADKPAASYVGLWVGTVTANAVSEPHFGSLTTNLYVLLAGDAVPIHQPGLILTTNAVPAYTNADGTIATTNLIVARTDDGAQLPIYEKVERTAAGQIPSPTRSEFNQRLIMHVDDLGQVRLLKEVVQMWRDGTYTNNAQGARVLDKPGRHVLVTQDHLLGQFKGVAVRDGSPVGRRLSAIGFDFDGKGTNHLAITGTFAPGRTLTTRIEIAPDYPLNPFRHKYHPDHDNLTAEFKPITDPARGESYAIQRELAFELAGDLPSTATNPDPAYGTTEGVYRETLTGLHKHAIHVQGTFRLSRISTIPDLNTSPIP